MDSDTAARRSTNVLDWMLTGSLAAVEIFGLWMAAGLIYFGQASCGTPIDRGDMHDGQVALLVLALVGTAPWLVGGWLTRGRLPVLGAGLVCSGYGAYLAVRGLSIEPWSHGFCF